MRLRVRSDGSAHGTFVQVLGKDGRSWGRLEGVQRVEWRAAYDGEPVAIVTVLRVELDVESQGAVLENVQPRRRRKG